MNQNNRAAKPLRFAFIAIILFVADCQTAADTPASRKPEASIVIPQDMEVEVNGVRLHYLDWGGEGRLMLLIPGLGHTAYVYNAVAPKFINQYHVVAVTRRNHGLSEKIGQAPEVDQLVDDLAAFLEQFTDESAIIVGQSFAGVEMPRLAQRYPEKVHAL